MDAAEEATILEEGMLAEIAFMAPGEVREWWKERLSSINRLKLMGAAAHQRVVDAAAAKSKEAA